MEDKKMIVDKLLAMDIEELALENLSQKKSAEYAALVQKTFRDRMEEMIKEHNFDYVKNYPFKHVYYKVSQAKKLDQKMMLDFIYSILSPEQKAQLHKKQMDGEFDTCYNKHSVMSRFKLEEEGDDLI